jgi:hypothetical protein
VRWQKEVVLALGHLPVLLPMTPPTKAYDHMTTGVARQYEFSPGHFSTGKNLTASCDFQLAGKQDLMIFSKEGD